MKLQRFLLSLGAPVQDAEEETFELFTQDLPSQNLGFIDSRATTLELTVAGRDLVITQSPGILSSNRAGGTTGAVTWKITPLFAAWLASPHNPLWTHALLTPTSRVLELGCGISGLVGLLLGPHIARYVLTDQPYVAKLLEQNLDANWRATSSHPSHSPPSLSPSPSPATTSTPSTNNSSNKPPRRSRSRPTSTSTTTPKTHRTSTPRRNSPARAARTGVVFTPSTGRLTP